MRGNRLCQLLRIIAVFGVITNSQLVFSEEAVSDEDKRVGMLTEYILYQKFNPPVPVAYGRQLIPDLIRLLKAEEKVRDLEKYMELRERKTTILHALCRAIKTFEGYPEADLGKRMIFELTDSPNRSLRSQALFSLAYLNPEAGIPVWLEKLSDSDLYTQVDAARLLGTHGNEDTAREIERIVEKRTQGLSAEQIAKDESLKWMRAAIAEIRDRTNGTPGPSVSERINAEDLAARSPTNVKAPQAPSAAAPAPVAPSPPPTVTRSPVAPASAAPAPVAAAVESSAPSTALLVAGAVLAVAALVGLLFLWKRRA